VRPPAIAGGGGCGAELTRRAGDFVPLQTGWRREGGFSAGEFGEGRFVRVDPGGEFVQKGRQLFGGQRPKLGGGGFCRREGGFAIGPTADGELFSERFARGGVLGVEAAAGMGGAPRAVDQNRLQ
jgi:hypothetical protein